MIGEGCDLGDKVTVKQCSIGKGCQIGAKSKLNNCVLMDYTIIGERCVTAVYLRLSTSDTVLHIITTLICLFILYWSVCIPCLLVPLTNICRISSRNSCTIQNTVLSAGCVVENNCNINECNVGCGAKIAAGSKIKSESISSAT